MKLQDMKLEDKQRKSSNRDYIRMQCLLLFSKHATVKCTRRNVYSLKKRQCIVVHYNHALLNFTYLRWTHYTRQFRALQLGPSISCLAFSCPAIWSAIFMSCISCPSFSAPPYKFSDFQPMSGYVRETLCTRKGRSHYGTVTVSHMRSATPWHFRWPWVTFEGHFGDLLAVVTLCAQLCFEPARRRVVLINHVDSTAALSH